MTKRLHSGFSQGFYMSLALKDLITDTIHKHCHYNKMDKFTIMKEYDIQALIIDSCMSKLDYLKGDRSRAETLPLLVRKEVVFLDTRSIGQVEDTQPELDSISQLYVD